MHGPGYDPCTELELAKSAAWTAAPAKLGLAARGRGVTSSAPPKFVPAVAIGERLNISSQLRSRIGCG
jgi:hypothetical protein